TLLSAAEPTSVNVRALKGTRSVTVVAGAGVMPVLSRGADGCRQSGQAVGGVEADDQVVVVAIRVTAGDAQILDPEGDALALAVAVGDHLRRAAGIGRR